MKTLDIAPVRERLDEQRASTRAGETLHAAKLTELHTRLRDARYQHQWRLDEARARIDSLTMQRTGLEARRRIEAEQLVVRSELRAIGRVTDALERMDAGTYGTCVECRDPLDTEWLDAIPELETCVPCLEMRNRAADTSIRIDAAPDRDFPQEPLRELAVLHSRHEPRRTYGPRHRSEVPRTRAGRPCEQGGHMGQRGSDKKTGRTVLEKRQIKRARRAEQQDTRRKQERRASVS